jgi:hypothetical protein
LAKELAEGASEEIWEALIHFSADYGVNDDGRNIVTYHATHAKVKTYIEARWENNIPDLNLLVSNGYLSKQGKSNFYIERLAFGLVQETKPSTIFISYKRSESSAFALLVLKSLKQEGLEPFLDLALEPGEDWHAGLKERIQSRDYFILLLGQTTLQSDYVIKEIEWALEKGLAIIPIWQRIRESVDRTTQPFRHYTLSSGVNYDTGRIYRENVSAPPAAEPNGARSNAGERDGGRCTRRRVG